MQLNEIVSIVWSFDGVPSLDLLRKTKLNLGKDYISRGITYFQEFLKTLTYQKRAMQRKKTVDFYCLNKSILSL